MWLKTLIFHIALITSIAFYTDAQSTILVPEQFSNLQTAINSAQNGDTILVSKGTYVGTENKNLNIKGKQIHLVSRSGADSTIIDCEGNGRGILLPQDQGSNLVLDGFTIQNGKEDNGGAILCIRGNTLTIQNCIIKNNNAKQGGGLYFSYCSPTIKNSTIMNNTASEWGGGLNFDNGGSPITNCLFIGNKSGTMGGGIVCQHQNSELINCTLSKNYAPEGGGVFLYKSTMKITNSILFYNSSPVGQEVYLWNMNGPSGAIIKYSDIQNGQNGVYIANGSTLTWGESNISDAPIFSDTANNNFYLQTSSPCIGSGISGTDMGFKQTSDHVTKLSSNLREFSEYRKTYIFLHSKSNSNIILNLDNSFIMKNIRGQNFDNRLPNSKRGIYIAIRN